MVLRVISGTPAQRMGTDLLVEPLRSVLEAGLVSGVFPSSQPEIDSLTIRAITSEALVWARAGTPRLSRREALSLVLRFSRAALGAKP